MCVTQKALVKVLKRHREQVPSTSYLYHVSSLVGEDWQPWRKVRVVLSQLYMVEKQGNDWEGSHCRRVDSMETEG